MALIPKKFLQQPDNCLGFAFKRLKKTTVRIDVQEHSSQVATFIRSASFLQKFGQLRCFEVLSCNARVDEMF